MKINVSLTWWMWMVLTKFTWMCFLAEWGIASQMAHRRSTANHADEYHANAVSSPCLPYDFRHRWQLYRFRTPVYLVRESYDSPSEYHVPHHRQAHIGNDSTLYLLRSVCTPDKLYAQLKKKFIFFIIESSIYALICWIHCFNFRSAIQLFIHSVDDENKIEAKRKRFFVLFWCRPSACRSFNSIELIFIFTANERAIDVQRPIWIRKWYTYVEWPIIHLLVSMQSTIAK